ncbi:MAG: hypothetical protein NVS2B8_06430 [Vulcanimicrobiaceae bacterium]
MRRNPIPALILVVAILGLVLAYAFFESAVLPRYKASRAVLDSKSEVRLALHVHHDRGPLVDEAYAMSDVDGVSTSSYRAVNRDGVQISITERPRATTEDGPNVAYFFQRTVQDGIWELRSRPARGDRSTQYTLDVYQLVAGKHGSRHMTFTDPHYWATTGGHQFTLKLDKHRPVPDLLHVTSTALVEPRYERVIADFRNFGPPSFRRKVSAARARLGAPAS